MKDATAISDPFEPLILMRQALCSQDSKIFVSYISIRHYIAYILDSVTQVLNNIIKTVYNTNITVQPLQPHQTQWSFRKKKRDDTNTTILLQLYYGNLIQIIVEFQKLLLLLFFVCSQQYRIIWGCPIFTSIKGKIHNQ